MKTFSFVLAVAFAALQSCGSATAQKEPAAFVPAAIGTHTAASLVNPEGKSLETRFLLPQGWERPAAPATAFATYLRQLPLKPHGSLVHYYDGRVKEREGVYAAVVDLNIGKRDLHQCADAVMRLRAEYLWSQQAYDQIHFNLTNGFRVDYKEWIKGKRVAVEGNKTWWKQSAAAGNTPESFWKYLEFIFAYAGTLSLEQELKPVSVQQLEIGDVFIQGGSPGHAIIVVDKAVQPQSGKVMFMLAQSYMPAQDLQILQNPVNKALSPWYEADFGDQLYTPEWTFKANELKRF